MIVRQVKDMARKWVKEEASKAPGFSGAFFTGSINWLSDDAPFPATSDVDVTVVTQNPDPPAHGMFRYQDILLEVSYLQRDRIQGPESILGAYTMADHFTKANILADPTGELTELRAAVSKEYARRKWVLRRCESVKELILTSLEWLNETDPFHDQIFNWIYPTSILTHLVLVADLKNPTVRKCFVAAREVLTRYHQLPLYESMLGLLGSQQLSRKQVEGDLASCAEAFDTAKGLLRTPFFFASYISDDARPIAIDGSRNLIENGDHREAVFWIVVTYSLCQKVLHNDAPAAIQDRFKPGYQRLLRELGITTYTDLQRRSEQTRSFLPRVWEAAEAIIAANPQIVK